MEEKQEKTNYILRLSLVNLVLITTSLIIILFRYAFLPPRLPLFYSRPWGEEQLAPKNALFIIPAAAFVFLIINFQVAKFLSKNETNFLSLVAASIALLFSVLGTIVVWKVVFLIT